MKICITGYKGFIGSYLIPLLEKKNELLLADIKDGVDIFGDLVEGYVRKSDVVIHLAALTNVEDSKRNPRPYYMTNVLGTGWIVYLCMKYNKKLIYPSTLHVGNPEASYYARTKLEAEFLVKMASKFIPAVILRLFNVFGKGMNNNSGSIINLFLKSDTIDVYGDGSVERDFIHVKDVAGVVVDALKPKWDGSIVGVGTGKGTSIKKLAQLFVKYRGVKIKYLKGEKQLVWPIANTKLLKQLYKKKLRTNVERDVRNLCKNV